MSSYSQSGLLLITTLVTGALALSGTVGATAGCGSCDCRLDGLYIQVPVDRAADVAQVAATGSTCHTNPPQCNGPSTPSCGSYLVHATQAGACHIQITFTSGAAPVEGDVDFESTGGCCGGLNPANGQGIIVPSLAIDAGGSGG